MSRITLSLLVMGLVVGLGCHACDDSGGLGVGNDGGVIKHDSASGGSGGGAGGSIAGSGGAAGASGAGGKGEAGSAGGAGTGGARDGGTAFCGRGGTPCTGATFCEAPSGTCGRDDQGGTCVAKPEVCALIFMPVCGCDGKTYGNDCERRGAGVSKEHDGECAKPGAEGGTCGGFIGKPCDPGLLCDQLPGFCKGADISGVCVKNPGAACNKILAPVCGCDGKTYDNDCLRLVAKVAKDHDGRCQ